MTQERQFKFDTAFASYHVSHILGEGGAGRVYAVLDDQQIKHALKVLDKSKISSDRLKRFKNEIHFCSSPRHKNIVCVTDHGLTSDLAPFYFMQIYSGTLRSLIRSSI